MRFRDLHINIKTRLIVSFFQRASQSMVFPFMSIYFADHFGPTIAGLLMLATVIAGLLSSFFGGYYADVKGRKKVLVVSELIRFVSLLFLAVVNSDWIHIPIITFFLFLINIILISISTPANEALIIDVSTTETRKYVYSISYWVTNFSLAIGAMFGSFFYKSNFFQLVIIMALSSLLSCIIIHKFVTDTFRLKGPVEKVSIVNIFRSYKTVFRNRLFMKYFLIGVLMLGVEMQLGNYISVRLAKEFGTQSIPEVSVFIGNIDGIKMFGIIRTVNTVLVVLLASVVARISHYISDRISFYLGVLLFVSGYAVLAISNDVWILLLAALVFTLGELIYVPVFQAMFAEIIPVDARSKYSAVNKLNVRGGMILGSLGITVGVLFPSWFMALLYMVIGFVSIYVYRNLLHYFQDQQNKTSHLESGDLVQS
ncbi:MFS transporter [Effusibacillus pohliae]|uniref:MFS transporter n=1 Tax=Effusibacillus pohliae TaxID=232270 RepID=UPI0003725E3A|nr:MFS transporter [Effusibacillus pohliae]